MLALRRAPHVRRSGGRVNVSQNTQTLRSEPWIEHDISA